MRTEGELADRSWVNGVIISALVVLQSMGLLKRTCRQP